MAYCILGHLHPQSGNYVFLIKDQLSKIVYFVIGLQKDKASIKILETFHRTSSEISSNLEMCEFMCIYRN